jgi:hypothetical protein
MDTVHPEAVEAVVLALEPPGYRGATRCARGCTTIRGTTNCNRLPAGSAVVTLVTGAAAPSNNRCSARRDNDKVPSGPVATD